MKPTGLFSSIALTIALLCIPLLIQLERTLPHTWSERLLLPRFEAEVARHTPRHASGTFLPPVIMASRTLTPADNPILITKQTHISAGATLTLTPGTQVFFHEFASLIIDGTLQATGTAAAPIYLRTNELHPLNQVWSGMTLTATGSGSLQHVQIEDASPGINCVPGSRLTAQELTILRGSMGIFTQSAACQFADTIINGARDGIVASGVAVPVLTGTSRVSGRHSNVTTYTAPLGAL